MGGDTVLTGIGARVALLALACGHHARYAVVGGDIGLEIVGSRPAILVVAPLSARGAESPADSSVTAGPFRIPAPATGAGGPRRAAAGL